MSKKVRRLILFGAGASGGSERASPYCPPLGRDLFDKLQTEYPDAWGTIPQEKRANFVPNFEPGMEELWKSGWHGTTGLMQCLGHYFAKFRPLSGNAYARLIEHLQAHEGIKGTFFSTINYDCLFEYGGRMRDFTIDYDAEEPSRDSVLSFWKIHGSCNFIPNPNNIAATRSGVSLTPAAVTWDCGVCFVDACQVEPFLKSSALYPSMAVFMEGKPIHSNPSFLKKLQDRWAKAVLESEKIGIIGVNPDPADGHIWDTLSITEAELVIIGNKEGYEQWSRNFSKPRKMKFVGEKFAEDLPKFSELFTS